MRRDLVASRVMPLLRAQAGTRRAPSRACRRNTAARSAVRRPLRLELPASVARRRAGRPRRGGRGRGRRSLCANPGSRRDPERAGTPGAARAPPRLPSMSPPLPPPPRSRSASVAPPRDRPRPSLPSTLSRHSGRSPRRANGRLPLSARSRLHRAGRGDARARRHRTIRRDPRRVGAQPRPQSHQPRHPGDRRDGTRHVPPPHAGEKRGMAGGSGAHLSSRGRASVPRPRTGDPRPPGASTAACPSSPRW